MCIRYDVTLTDVGTNIVDKKRNWRNYIYIIKNAGKKF